jgi:NitT/TauT family transport system permease protein
MANVGAVILIIAMLGVLIYVVFFLIGRRWASWEA